MGDESSCFHLVFYQIIRIKRAFAGIFRRIFKSSSVQQQQNGIEAVASVNPEPIQGVRVYEDNLNRDPLRLQIVVSFIPEPPAAIPPPPPLPPPLPSVSPRRRRHSRPIPTYDLATLIEIKDALETLEMGGQVVAVNNNLEISNQSIAQSSNKNTKPNKIDL